MTGRGSAPTHLQLLRTAYGLGREDGVLAAAFEPAGSGHPDGRYCQGRRPEAFARRLWAEQPGDPPAGLELCAPVWYATGFAEGLASCPAATALPLPPRSQHRALLEIPHARTATDAKEG